MGIGFVKIQDEDLAEEYNLGELPRLVYYRHQIPIIYESKLFHLVPPLIAMCPADKICGRELRNETALTAISSLSPYKHYDSSHEKASLRLGRVLLDRAPLGLGAPISQIKS